MVVSTIGVLGISSFLFKLLKLLIVSLLLPDVIVVAVEGVEDVFCCWVEGRGGGGDDGVVFVLSLGKIDFVLVGLIVSDFVELLNNEPHPRRFLQNNKKMKNNKINILRKIIN